MSKRAGELIGLASKNQLMKNDARRVRTRVDEARRNPEDAGVRWPFELLQNATDAGPRVGADGVTIRIGWVPTTDGYTVIFEHNGQPFDTQDLAALLSGGSSKDYESEVTTGRFGTGFLVTHVLSLVVRLQGLLNVDGELEYFAIDLDRSGDEDAIVSSRNGAELRLDQAVPIGDASTQPSARFEWTTKELSAYQKGIEALTVALPFVFGTRDRLLSVVVMDPQGAEVRWTADVPIEQIDATHRHVTRDLWCHGSDGELRAFRVVRFVEGQASALILLEMSDDDRWMVGLPPESLARIFCRFPVRGTHRLPLQLILDGPFDLDQERRQVLLDEKGRQLVSAALTAGTAAVQFALQQKWARAHRLAMAAQPLNLGTASEQKWWKEALGGFAWTLARLPLVASIRGHWSAVRDKATEQSADFPLPLLRADDTGDELPLEQMWSLMAGTSIYKPPVLDIAGDWAEIAKGWATLGVSVRRVCLAVLAADVAKSGSKWNELGAVEKPKEWILALLDAVGCAWTNRRGIDTSVLEGLLPDQNGNLHGHADLERDGGIPEELKNIAHALGKSVRRRLLHLEVERAARDIQRWPSLASALNAALPRVRTKEQVIEECLSAIESRLPVQKTLGSDERKVAEIARQLLLFLWAQKGEAAAAQVSRIPLLVRNGQCDRASATRKMMLPASCWRATAQRYVEAWPPGRVLDNIFAEQPFIEALVRLDLAFTDVLTRGRAVELDKQRLAGMCYEPLSAAELDGLVVKDESFPAIALMHEVLNRCQEGEAQARALLGLVVDCLGREEKGWKMPRDVVGVRRGEKIPLRVREALWLGDLRGRSWVPTRDETGATAKVRANAVSLGPLLEVDWLIGNAGGIELLTDCFGFDRLELELLSATPDTSARQGMRQQLAELLAATSGRPELLRTVIAAAADQQRQQRSVDVLKMFGLAVQRAVKAYLNQQDLTVTLIDRGFDYKVELGQALDVEEIDLARFEVGPWLVEVKATTRNEVGLTPLQARTAGANGDRFVLCVVPFDTIPEIGEKEEELVKIVQASARIVLNLGPDALRTTTLVQTAASSEVGIRNDQHLRYAVPRRRWEAGITIEAWVKTLRTNM